MDFRDDPEFKSLRERYVKTIGTHAPSFSPDEYGGFSGYKDYLRQCIQQKRELKPPLLEESLRRIEDWTKNE